MFQMILFFIDTIYSIIKRDTDTESYILTRKFRFLGGIRGFLGRISGVRLVGGSVFNKKSIGARLPTKKRYSPRVNVTIIRIIRYSREPIR